MTAPAPCLDCQHRDSEVRGLCNTCYHRHRYGRHADMARVNWTADELLAEWVLLRDEGVSVRDAPPRMGVTFAALDRALCRARARGDIRGRRTVFGRDLTGARS